MDSRGNASRITAARGARAGVFALAAVTVLGACRAPPPAGSADRSRAGEVAAAPAAASEPRTPQGTRYRILPDRSLIAIQVFRGGPMARLGHDHVIGARQIVGEARLAERLEQSEFAFTIATNLMTVDDPELRAAAGPVFAAPVPDAAREGTLRNLLGASLLRAAEFPGIEVQSREVLIVDGQPRVTLQVTVAGVTSQLVVPFALQRTPQTLIAEGAIPLRQSELGLTPFSVMMGALQVQDEMQISFRLVAEAPRGTP
jgi:polyisoprenoid-binding protein YceI